MNLHLLTCGTGGDIRNIAEGKKCLQSSTHDENEKEYNCAFAINGHTDDGRFSHTKSVVDSFWRLDLQEEYYIYHVVLFNRKDFCKSSSF